MELGAGHIVVSKFVESSKVLLCSISIYLGTGRHIEVWFLIANCVHTAAWLLNTGLYFNVGSFYKLYGGFLWWVFSYCVTEQH